MVGVGVDKCELDQFMTGCDSHDARCFRLVLGRQWRNCILRRLVWLGRFKMLDGFDDDPDYPVWYLVLRRGNGVVYIDTAEYRIREFENLEDFLRWYI